MCDEEKKWLWQVVKWPSETLKSYGCLYRCTWKFIKKSSCEMHKNSAKQTKV